jgi:hypothetical protein
MSLNALDAKAAARLNEWIARTLPDFKVPVTLSKFTVRLLLQRHVRLTAS